MKAGVGSDCDDCKVSVGNSTAALLPVDISAGVKTGPDAVTASRASSPAVATGLHRDVTHAEEPPLTDVLTSTGIFVGIGICSSFWTVCCWTTCCWKVCCWIIPVMEPCAEDGPVDATGVTLVVAKVPDDVSPVYGV
jgi:hypothetical protein